MKTFALFRRLSIVSLAVTCCSAVTSFGAITPTISVDGYSHGAVITRPVSGGTPAAVSIGVRFKATVSSGTLTGIRYNIWNSTTGYFDNGGGGFVPQSGTSGEVFKTVSLSTDGDWYFWTDAQDSNGGYASTGDWTSGLKITVQQPPKTNSLSASPNPIQTGQSITFTANATDPNNNLWSIHFYVNGPGMPGWNHVGSKSVSGGNATTTFNWTVPSQAGTYSVHIRAQDSHSAYDWNANVTASFTVLIPQPAVSSQNATRTVNQAFTPTYSGGAGSGAWQFVVSGQTNWGGTQPGTLLYPSNAPSTSWTPTQAGTYDFWVRKIGDSTYLNSNHAGPYTLTVNKANQSTVSVSPTTQTVTVGQSITFSASGGSGSGAFTWGGDASGTGPSKTVTFNSVGTRTVTVYRASDSNYNQSNTATAIITVIKANQPTVTISPTSQTINQGSSITFTATGGAGSGAYAWGGDASGAGTTKTVTFNLLGSRTVTVYRAGDSNYNQSNTASATITVIVPTSPPSIATHPASQTIATGNNVTFTVAASGTPTLTYQWRKGGVNIAGATSASYTISNLQTSHAGGYSVLVSNSYGNATSNTATLTVTTSAPSITTQPASQAVNVGQPVNFSVVAVGSLPMSYQWRKNGVDISGATASSYSIGSVQASHAGGYSVYVSNAYGNITSSTATLTVSAAPVITSQPQNQSVAAGGTATFSVVATGSPAPSYQWRKNGVNLSNGGNVSGATSATLTLTNAQSSDAATYTVYVSNSMGSVTSNGATLTITTAQNDSTNQNQLNIHLPSAP